MTAVSEDFPRNNDQAAMRFNACVLVSSDPAQPAVFQFHLPVNWFHQVDKDCRIYNCRSKVSSSEEESCICLKLLHFHNIEIKKYYPTTEMKQSNITRRDKLTHISNYALFQQHLTSAQFW